MLLFKNLLSKLIHGNRIDVYLAPMQRTMLDRMEFCPNQQRPIQYMLLYDTLTLACRTEDQKVKGGEQRCQKGYVKEVENLYM